VADIALVILAAGRSTRFESGVKKQWLWSGDKPLWQNVADHLMSLFPFSSCTITAHADDLRYMEQFETGYTIIEGASERQYSLSNALQTITSPYVLVTDVARACIDPSLLERLIAHKESAECIVPYLSISDTVVGENDQIIERSYLKRIQTPQLSKTAFLKQALTTNTLYTDESTLIKAHGGSVHYVEGDHRAEKLTYLKDLLKLPCLKAPNPSSFVGYGFDVHPFEEGKPMRLGGVGIESEFGFKAHSDGDVALHALIDALLGAASIGDIGELFPDTDNRYKNIDSRQLLERSVQLITRFGYEIVNVDVTIMAQTPRLAPYKRAMRQAIATLLELPPIRVNIKATTTEKLGFVGRKEGVAVSAVANLKLYDWTQQ